MTTICWFRQDLRVTDNPALAWAASRGQVIPLYILEPGEASVTLGGASLAWLEASLAKLNDSLDGALCVIEGRP